MTHKRICITCGNAYDYDYHNKTQSTNFCTDNCRDVFDLASDICFGVVSDTVASERLKKLDISYVKDSYKEIFARLKPTTKKKVSKTETEIVNED